MARSTTRVAARLNELDDEVGRAVAEGDEARALARAAGARRRGAASGQKLDDADLSPSDAIIPPEDLSLEEAHELLEGEGLIPGERAT